MNKEVVPTSTAVSGGKKYDRKNLTARLPQKKGEA